MRPLEEKKGKILILGGADDQVPLIKAAKDLNLIVICIDYTVTNPGLHLADKHYQVDYMEREAVLDIAYHERIKGIISNSEAAADSVAYVVEHMRLVGNTIRSIHYLNNKASFRNLQDKVGIFAPRHCCVRKVDEVFPYLKQMVFPIIIKPSMSSATRGIRVLNTDNPQEIIDAFEECLRYSRTVEVEIEEYVPMPTLSVIEGEIFVAGKDILFDGLFETKRTGWAPMIPAIYSCPLYLSQDQLKIIKDNVTKLIFGSGLQFGEFNIEMYFTTSGELFIIELNPRQGGRRLPQFLKEHNGIDYYRLLVSLAVGDLSYYNEIKSAKFIPGNNAVTKFMVFGSKNGIYGGLYISKEIKPYIISLTEFIPKGKTIRHAQNGTDAIAMVDFRFDDFRQQRSFVNEMEKFVYPVIL